MTLEADVQKGYHDAIVEMFDVDLSVITNDPADIFYFTNQLKEDGTKVQWKGNVYEPLPIISTGYDKNTNGQIAQPTLTVANVLGTFTQVVASYDDLVGAKVTRRRTLQKYLDGEAQADPLQEFPVDIFYIERKSQETALTITWQLSSVLDLEGVKLPRRIITQNLCVWKYRGSECGYTGAPVFDSRDKLISATGQSAEAIAVINNFQLREQRKVELKTAISVRDQAIGTKEAKCQDYVLLERRFSLLPGNFVVKPELFAGAFVDIFTARFDGNLVTLGLTYRQGRPAIETEGSIFYEIERWGVDAAGCSAATSDLATAEANVSTAQTNLNNAEAALTAAIAALPLNDPLLLDDVCGKRVTSCALRFPEQSLPFGGFPGANLTRS